MIRDRIVFGCSSEKCREKLINEGDKLTMDKEIQIVQNYEYCQKTTLIHDAIGGI